MMSFINPINCKNCFCILKYLEAWTRSRNKTCGLGADPVDPGKKSVGSQTSAKITESNCSLKTIYSTTVYFVTAFSLSTVKTEVSFEEIVGRFS